MNIIYILFEGDRVVEAYLYEHKAQEKLQTLQLLRPKREFRIVQTLLKKEE